MNIEDFKIQVNEEQSKIVQEVLFENGYKWRNGCNTVSSLTYNFIVFDKEDGGLGWQTPVEFSTSPPPEITFEQFKEKYMEKNKEEDFFERAYKSLCKMQQAKNKNYGESALKPLDIFAKHHNYGSRLDEKLARVKNCIELRKNDVADIIGGLMLICKDKGWDNFDDLID